MVKKKLPSPKTTRYETLSRKKGMKRWSKNEPPIQKYSDGRYRRGHTSKKSASGDLGSGLKGYDFKIRKIK